MKEKKLAQILRHRMSLWLWLTVALTIVIAFTARHMLTVLVWKVALLTISAYVGYWVSRGIEASGARPHELLDEAAAIFHETPERSWQLEQLAAAAYQRRAWIVSACMIAAALGT